MTKHSTTPKMPKRKPIYKLEVKAPNNGDLVERHNFMVMRKYMILFVEHLATGSCRAPPGTHGTPEAAAACGVCRSIDQGMEAERI